MDKKFVPNSLTHSLTFKLRQPGQYNINIDMTERVVSGHPAPNPEISQNSFGGTGKTTAMFPSTGFRFSGLSASPIRDPFPVNAAMLESPARRDTVFASTGNQTPATEKSSSSEPHSVFSPGPVVTMWQSRPETGTPHPHCKQL